MLNSIYCSDACKRTDEERRPQRNMDLDELVSPLLAPSSYQTELRDLDYFDLNYSVLSNTNYTKFELGETCGAQSTSHNYRKWLTACL